MGWFRRGSTKSDGIAIEELIEQNVRLADAFSDAQHATLVALTGELIDQKSWEATQDMELSDEVLVTVAANAAIPVLNLGSWVYRQVRSIIIHPTETLSHGTRATSAQGVYQDDPARVVGMATPHSGPLSLSWDAALLHSRNPSAGHNVIIHEFARKIDMSDGFDDGVPPVRGVAAQRWTTLITHEFERTEWSASDNVLDSYAWASPAEFFAVATETYFCRREALAKHKPTLCAALEEFYGG